MSDHPTPWQRKICWSALSAVSLAVLATLFVALIWVAGKTIGFLQPLLVPVAIAGILAFLLDPVVIQLGRLGVSRRRAVLLVFALVSVLILTLLVWLVPIIYGQSVRLGTKLPGYTLLARDRLLHLLNEYGQKLDLPRWLPGMDRTPSPARDSQPGATPGAGGAIPLPDSGLEAGVNATPDGAGTSEDAGLPPPDTNPVVHQLSVWLNQQIPTVTSKVWSFIQRSVGGFLGVFGFVFSMVVVPLYLYYFLIEWPNIARGWADYLPLRTSHFKDEVVASLTEINHYLIAFFRGQLVVSLINGVATGAGLMLVGLDFGLVIGLMLCVLGIIPYLGIMLCWIPAVIIAIVQGGSYLIPGGTWWVFPLVVTGIFLLIQQIDGFFITPRIVGESVGLHPVTVILSMFGWSLLLGGLLGALLAVPLSATLKVILRRYVWQRRLLAPPPEPDVSP